MDTDRYRPLPHRENDSCFACSPHHPSGLRMRFFTDGRSIVTRLRVPEHLSGWDNLVHGGIISTMLDEAMGWAALHLLKSMTLTKSLTVDFLKPIHVEEAVRIESRIAEVKSPREAIVESCLYNESDDVCARGRGTFALFTIEAMRKRGIVDETVLEDVEQLLEAR